MKHALLVAALLAAPLTSLSPAFAADGPPVREYKPVADKPVAEIDPAKSYIIVQTETATPLTFIRRPDKEDIDDYLRRRNEALAKAHGKWEKKQANWVRDAAAWDKGGSSRTGPRPVKPVEPTDANLAFPAIEQENMVSIGPFNRFAKERAAQSSCTWCRPAITPFTARSSSPPRPAAPACAWAASSSR